MRYLKTHNNFLKENLISHAKKELKLAGLFDKDSDYNGLIGKAVMDLMKTFSKQGHSGLSAAWVRELFFKLTNFQNLTPITSQPNEWENVSDISDEILYQNKRNPAIFSNDGGKTWWNVDDKNIKENIKYLKKYYNDKLNENINVLAYHKKLNPKFWDDDDKLDQGIRKKLLKIARDFYDSVELDTEIIDIYFMGSMCNYNYSKLSDLDTHIIIDYEKAGPKDLVLKAVEGERFQWNTRHKISLRGHDVELYIQDVNEKKSHAAIYSLLNNEWVQKPKYDPPKITEEDILPKYNSYVYEITELEKILKTETDLDEIEKYYKRSKNIKKKLSEARVMGIKSDGEFSIENLVFKKLRNNGFIGKLINIKNELYDKMFVQ
jgi:hypothetical protein